VDWCLEPVRQTSDSPCPPRDGHLHSGLREKGAALWTSFIRAARAWTFPRRTPRSESVSTARAVARPVKRSPRSGRPPARSWRCGITLRHSRSIHRLHPQMPRWTGRRLDHPRELGFGRNPSTTQRPAFYTQTTPAQSHKCGASCKAATPPWRPIGRVAIRLDWKTSNSGASLHDQPGGSRPLCP